MDLLGVLRGHRSVPLVLVTSVSVRKCKTMFVLRRFFPFSRDGKTKGRCSGSITENLTNLVSTEGDCVDV